MGEGSGVSEAGYGRWREIIKHVHALLNGCADNKNQDGEVVWWAWYLGGMSGSSLFLQLLPMFVMHQILACVGGCFT